MDIVLFFLYWAGFSCLFWGIILWVDSAIAEHAATFKVGGIRFIRYRRYCVSFCRTRRTV